MLKFRRSNTAANASDFSAFPSQQRQRRAAGSHETTIQLDRKCSFVSSQLGHSRAAVLLRNVSIPLAWPVEEYFGAKKEWREFTVQLALRSADGQELLSKPVEKINRTFTDVEFADEFIFIDQAPNFCIELTVYCKRTDEGAHGNVVANISRSLGRSLGHSWKKYLHQQQELERQRTLAVGGEVKQSAPGRSFLEALRKAGEEIERTGTTTHLPPIFDEQQQDLQVGRMFAIGIARFQLRNASLSGRAHNYTLEKQQFTGTSNRPSQQMLLPLYGSVGAQILVQPSSLVTPLAQGSMDIFLTESGTLHQRLRCVLQGGQLRCWTPRGSAEMHASTISLNTMANGTPLLRLPINEHTRVEKTAFASAFRLLLAGAPEIAPDAHTLLCICATQSALLGWKSALHLQILDCSVWSEFALTLRNPHGAGLGPLPGTGPPPFQPLNEAERENEAEMIGQSVDNKNSATLPRAPPAPEHIEEVRHRTVSSASMLVRNAVKNSRNSLLSLGDQMPPNTSGMDAEGQLPQLRVTQLSPSRTTLVDTNASTITVQSVPKVPASTNGTSPVARRRRKLPPTQSNGATSEGNGAPHQSLPRRLAERPKHISWSLRELPGDPKQRTNVREVFEKLDENANVSKMEEPSPLIEEEEREEDIAEQKNKQSPVKPNYVISLCIGESDEKALENENSTPTSSTSTLTAFPAVKEDHDFAHKIHVNLSNSSGNSSQPAHRAVGNNSVKNQHLKAVANRPFNIAADLAPQEGGRWARAHLGRSETWHFARISDACTRL